MVMWRDAKPDWLQRGIVKLRDLIFKRLSVLWHNKLLLEFFLLWQLLSIGAFFKLMSIMLSQTEIWMKMYICNYLLVMWLRGSMPQQLRFLQNSEILVWIKVGLLTMECEGHYCINKVWYFSI